MIEVVKEVAHGPVVFIGERVLVALTGRGSQEDHDATARAGFDVHLVKPVNLEHLQSTLSTVESNRRRVRCA